jgi:3-hydroxyacyl-CoA dehydrogenase
MVRRSIPTIAIIAQGAMGSAIGRLVAVHGARVLTLLEGGRRDDERGLL